MSNNTNGTTVPIKGFPKPDSFAAQVMYIEQTNQAQINWEE